MGLPVLNNNGLETTCDVGRGVTTHLRNVPNPNDALFIIGKGLAPNKKLLNKHFPIIVGRSNKTLYFLLIMIFATPLRSARQLVLMAMSNNRTMQKNLNILVDMGYIQVENKPRKIIPFQAYVLDKVYRITAKGVKVLSAITGY